MKMHKVGLALSLSAMLLAGHSATVRAEINLMPQDVSAAPHFSQTSLQSLTWQPLDTSRAQVTVLDGSHSRWNVPGMTGPVAAYSLPATLGELTITLSSEVQNSPGQY